MDPVSARTSPYKALRRFNNALSILIVTLCLYIIIVPFWPNISLWWQSLTNSRPALVKANSQTVNKDTPAEDMPKDNTLVIPSINMQEIIYDGPNEYTLNKGTWRIPSSSSPDKGSNTVLAGHRFTYRGAAVFYHLDKVNVGDKIVMYWQGKKYIYQVSRTYVVPPTAVEIEKPTKDSRLTIYTCTPLWTSKSRLVIEALPSEAL